MIKFKTLILAFLLLLCPAILRAQWSGSVDVSAGLGIMNGDLVSDTNPQPHVLTQGNFKLNYKTDKFSTGTTINAKWEPKTKDNTRLSYKNEKAALVHKSSTTQPLSVNIRQDFSWRPASFRNYSAWLLYQYKNDRAENYSLNYSEEGSLEKYSYYYEMPLMDEHKLQAGMKTFRDFDGGKHILQSSVSLQAVGSQKLNTWIVFKSDNDKGKGTAIKDQDNKLAGYAWMYRITPGNVDLSADGDIRLQNRLVDADTKLTVTPGMRIAYKQLLDQNSGATFIPDGTQEGGQWQDSLRLRESFDYLSIQEEQYVQASANWGPVEANAEYAMQVYGRRLNDASHTQPFQIKGVYPVGKANVKWIIHPEHSLSLVHQMSVKHPDYLKVCWYDRTAGYLDQLYRGNEQLLSPQTTQFTLEYAFKGKHFSAKSGISYKSVINEIDQTWSNEDIDGRMYKVFRWLNSSDSHAMGLSQQLGWEGKVLSAHVEVTYNQTLRTAKKDNAQKTSHDWKLKSDVSARLGKGWTAGFDTKYQSKVATFFTIFKEYCELNAFVQKDFKKISVYLQGKDLLDMPRETSFESEDHKEYWIDRERNNRRLIILGLRWKF
ncbi:MAG: outer membrane beta-barrel protein [Bacteroidales bacterium]|nr:outer membrane beta-barrel protein [Bacteroidales bacterium]